MVPVLHRSATPPMSVLIVLRPTKHPKTGVLWFRAKVPSALRSTAGKQEVTWTLGTKDTAEAMRCWPDALRKWQSMCAEWERMAKRETLTKERAREIAATWGAWVAAGGSVDRAGVSVPEPGEPWEAFSARVAVHAQEALKFAGIAVSDDTLPMLLEAMSGIVLGAYWQAQARERSAAEEMPMFTDPLALARSMYPTAKVPAVTARAPAKPSFTLEAMWQGWSDVTATGARTVHETLGMLKQLQSFLGHDDAGKVTKADVLRWRDSLKADGLSNNTWNNRLSLIGQVFKQAVADGRIPANPTDGARLAKGRVESWRPYTDDEAALILNAARQETKPSLRWAHWVMALSGMRVGEVLQLTAGDIKQDPKSGLWFIDVRPDPMAGKSVKNDRPRNVPVHPALASEGFLTFAGSVPGDDPLFSDKKPDRYGRMGGRAWNLVGTWVRETVGVTDPKTAPNHSWRHRMEDELRAAEVPEDARDAIVGHQRKTTGRLYGVRGEALARLHRELAKVPPPGVRVP